MRRMLICASNLGADMVVTCTSASAMLYVKYYVNVVSNASTILMILWALVHWKLCKYHLTHYMCS